MTQHTVTGKVSLYSFADNDVNGNFGTYATASGINATSSLPTAAVQMDGRDGFALGDVLLVQKGDRQVIVLATDVGGLPHAQVDIFDGDAAKKLNMNLGRNGSATFVKAADGSNDPELTQGYTITRIGHFPNLRGQHDNHQPNERSAAVLNTIKAINNGEQPASALQALQQQGILESVSLPEKLQQPTIAETQQNPAFMNMAMTNSAITQPQSPTAQQVSQPPAPPPNNNIFGMIMGMLSSLFAPLMAMLTGNNQTQPQQPEVTATQPVNSAQQPSASPQVEIDPPLATPAMNMQTQLPRVP